MTSAADPYLFEPTPRFTIPVDKNGDLVVEFENEVDGVVTPFGGGVGVTLVVDASPTPVSSACIIDGSVALCKIESTVMDDIPRNTPWRVRVTYPTIPPTDIVSLKGLLSRDIVAP